MVVIGAGEGEGMHGKEGGVETVTGSGGDARTSGKEVANLTPGSGCSSTGPMKTTTVAVAVKEVGGSTKTKRPGVCSCSPVAHTQEAAVRRGMVGEDR